MPATQLLQSTENKVQQPQQSLPATQLLQSTENKVQQPQQSLPATQLLQSTENKAQQPKPTSLADQLNNLRSFITGTSLISSASLQAKIYNFALTKLMPKSKVIAPNMTPELAEQMIGQTLQYLKQDNGQAFDESIHLTGTTLWQHIYRRHVCYVNQQITELSRSQINLNDETQFDDAKTSWFIASVVDGKDVLTQIKQYVAAASITPKQWLISYQVKDGILRLKLQFKFDNLPFYYNNQYQTQGYLNICLQKVWLDDHWSGNLMPGTIFLSTTPIRWQQIVNTKQPTHNLQQEYRKLEQSVTALAPLAPTKIPQPLTLNSQQPIEIQLDNQDTLPTTKPCFVNTEGSYEGKIKNGKKHGKGTMFYANGDVYDGEWEKDKRTGNGTMTWKDGRVYQGEWKNNKPDGTGAMTFQGNSYTGTFNKGVFIKGKVTYPDKRQYTGSLGQDGNPTNDGIMQYADGNIYKGQFKQGKRHGFGSYETRDNLDNKVIYRKSYWDNDQLITIYEFTDVNGSYIGEWDLNKTGTGACSFINGDEYNGLWQNGQPHGQGTMIIKKLGTYVGEFVHGQPNNQGTMWYPNGSRYTGQLQQWRRTGQGVIYKKNELTGITAQWQDDQIVTTNQFTNKSGIYSGAWDNHGTGTGKCIFTNGDEYNGAWQGSKPHGQGKMIIKNIGTYTGEFIQGEPSESGILQYLDGTSYKGQLQKWRRHGHGIFYQKDDVVGITAQWQQDQIVTVIQFIDQDGNIYSGMWRNNQPHGQGTMIIKNIGTYTGEFIQGEPSESGILRYLDGTSYKGQLQQWQRHGHGVLYKKDVVVGITAKWQQDKVVTLMQFTNTGGSYFGAWDNHGNGVGKYVFINGDEYDGAWKDNQPHGQGRMIIKNIGTYTGEFIQGEPSESGILRYLDGTSYKGQLQQWRRHGHGILYQKDDVVGITAQWQDDQIVTVIQFIDQDGNIYSGMWHNNQPHGQGAMIIKNIGTYTGEFIQGEPSESGILQYFDGTSYKGQLRKWQRHGHGTVNYQKYDADCITAEWECNNLIIDLAMEQYKNADMQHNLGICYQEGIGVTKNETEAVDWYLKAAMQEFAAAQFQLGNCYQEGAGVIKDKIEAFKWYQKAAEQGHAPAQNALGLCYQNGIGVLKNQLEAVKWYQKAAEQGDAFAQNALGNCYYKGIGVRKDEDESVKWYRKAAEQGQADAQYNLGAICQVDGDVVLSEDEAKVEAVKWFKKAADQGHAHAQNSLGRCYQTGLGIIKDEVEAVKWYQKAAMQEFAAAQYNLGICYQDGVGVRTDEAESVKWYQKAAEQGHAPAQNALGRCYQKGMGIAKDENEAIKWFLKAANQGNSAAQHNLGFCYQNGIGVRKDEEESVKWYRKAAVQKFAFAQNALGLCYQAGKGITKDENEAIKWFLKAADQGHASAQYNLGVCYQNSIGMRKYKSEAEAVKWYQKAAEQGYASAQNALGSCYQKGTIITKDENEAIKWFLKAANQGHVSAQYNLGVCYQNGIGVRKDEGESVKWYRKAAEQGYAPAQNALSLCYQKGIGVRKDEKLAAFWLEKAAEKGPFK